MKTVLEIFAFILFFSGVAGFSFVVVSEILRRCDARLAAQRVAWDDGRDKVMDRAEREHASLSALVPKNFSEDMPHFPACGCYRRVALKCGRAVCTEAIIRYLPTGDHEMNAFDIRTGIFFGKDAR